MSVYGPLWIGRNYAKRGEPTPAVFRHRSRLELRIVIAVGGMWAAHPAGGSGADASPAPRVERAPSPASRDRPRRNGEWCSGCCVRATARNTVDRGPRGPCRLPEGVQPGGLDDNGETMSSSAPLWRPPRKLEDGSDQCGLKDPRVIRMQCHPRWQGSAEQQ